ncbi:DEAD/DEAH box helicase [Verrucomicrobiota bacterium sgz303538]
MSQKHSIAEQEGGSARVSVAARKTKKQAPARPDKVPKARSTRIAEAVEPEPPAGISFRVVAGTSDVRLESRDGARSEWAVVRKSRFDQFAKALDMGTLQIADEASAMVLTTFGRGILENGTLAYTAPESAPALSELLRNPLLASHIVTANGKPFHRETERLDWRVTVPKAADGNYDFALVLPDGTKPPQMLAGIDGTPALYLTADTIYEAPAFAALNPDPAQSNLIPAAAFETSRGIGLLDKLGIPVPEPLASRVERYQPRFLIECWVKETPREEYLMVKFRAEWQGAAPDEMFTGRGWVRPNGATSKPTPGKIVCLNRNPLRSAPTLASQLAASWSSIEQAWMMPVGRDFPEQFSAWLLALPPEAELELDKTLTSLRKGSISAGVRLEIKPSGVDWFDVRAVLDLPDMDLSQEEIRTLLEAKGAWVRLGEEGWRRLALRWGQLDEEKLADLGLSTADFTGEPQRLHILQLANDSATRLMEADRADEVRRRADELRARVNPPVPSVINAELRPYQVEGFHFLSYLAANHFGGVLADDMGLGKTLQTLTWLAWLREQPEFAGIPSLVICPKSVTSNWQAEARRFLPGVRVRIWAGGTPEELNEAVRSCDLLVLNYAQLRLQSEALLACEWHAVIIDEAQAIKNPDSQTAKTACALRAVHRLAVTGTPLENRLLDLWSIFAFAMPGVLGQRARFTKDYDKAGDSMARRRLAGRVRPFMIRRTKNQVARDLPPRMEEDMLCELEGKQKTLYRAEMKRAQQMLLKINTAKELDKQRFNVLTSLLRLRQICCHPALISAKNAEANSAKLEALLEMLEPLMEEGHKVLVFSQFVGALEIIRDAITERGWRQFILTGGTENRGELVNEFQTTEGAAVFLISLKAGGAGLNLTAASYVVLFDPWWNPAVENQAIDRTHRIGQKQQVIAYRLLMRGTIEEKIRGMQRDKSAMADDLLGEESFAKALTVDDLRFLFTDDTEQGPAIAVADDE